jgi:prepilin-type N-terminal cleavage/methylation domain-containing protein
MRKDTHTRGFTLIEIMIVVAIIGLLVAIALPNFIRARQRSVFNTAQGSMKQIEGAVEQARLDGIGITNWTETVVSAVIVPEYIKTWPLCPGGGAWDIPDLEDGTMSCTIDGVTFTVTNQYTEFY